jgi:hypothetical protein
MAVRERRIPCMPKRMIACAAAMLLAGGAVAKADTLPGAAQTVLDTVEALDMPVLPGAVAGVADKFKKKSATRYEIADAGIGEVKGRLVFYRPPGKDDWIFAAVLEGVSFSGVGIGDGGLLDQVAAKRLVIVHAPKTWGATSVANWKGRLGEHLKDISEKAGKTLDITKGLNLFARLDAGASGEVADLIKLAGIDLSEITLDARKEVSKAQKSSSKKQLTMTVRLHHLADWSKPFGLAGTTLKNVTLQMEKDAKNVKAFQAWGDFTLKQKSYFLWGAQTKGPASTGRAIGLSAPEIALSAILDFADALPAFASYKFGKAVQEKLPVQDIKIRNASFEAYVPGTFPDLTKFTLLYAEPKVRVADTKYKGPLFAAAGTTDFMKWEAGTLNLFMDPKNGKLNVSGEVNGGPLDPLSMSDATFSVNVDKRKKKYKMGAKGKVAFEGVTLSGVAFNVSTKAFDMELNLGCIPPMLKGTISASYSPTAVPKLSDAAISGSGCGRKIADALADAAKKVGHTLKNGIKNVGNAIADAARAIAGKDKREVNGDVPLFRTAAKHMLLKQVLDDWPAGVSKVDISSIVLDGYDIPYDLGGVKVMATKKKIEAQLDEIECQARGRLARRIKWQRGLPDALEPISDGLEAEIKFYEPFESYKKKVKKTLDNMLTDPKAWAALQLCESG